MTALLRRLFFACIARPLVIIFFGLNIRHAQRLPKTGPALIVANHNSHLDTLVLMALFPLRMLKDLRPVAAADYFQRSKFLAWFSRHIIGVIFIDREGTSRATFTAIGEALEAGQLVIVYPEGSRGEPETLAEFKSGVSYLAQKHPDVPVIPIFLHGLGKALPKTDWLPVPFFIDVFVGESHYIDPETGRGKAQRHAFMQTLNESMQALASEGHFPAWE
ncbi:MAG: lysophospholipid acyltransferase family protein [Deinococcota bacterium]